MNAPLLFLRLVTGGVFIFSGWQKLMAPIEEFRAVILEYRFFPQAIAETAAAIVPWMELGTGVLVVLGICTRWSGAVLALLLSSFIFLLVRSQILGFSILECGCFGSGLTLSPKQAILFDSCLLMCCLMLIRKGAGRWSLDHWFNRA